MDKIRQNNSTVITKITQKNTSNNTYNINSNYVL